MLIGFTSSRKIKDYKDSKLAKSENNDCVVRALAVVFDITYDEAHKLAQEEFKRKNKKGTRNTIGTLRRLQKEDYKLNKRKIEVIKGDRISYVGSTRFIHEKNKQKDERIRVVVRMLPELYPKGTFIVLVREHAFAMVDGVIIGNSEDKRKKKTKVMNLVEIKPV